jgi:hypothetical protein
MSNFRISDPVYNKGSFTNVTQSVDVDEKNEEKNERTEGDRTDRSVSGGGGEGNEKKERRNVNARGKTRSSFSMKTSDHTNQADFF